MPYEAVKGASFSSTLYFGGFDDSGFLPDEQYYKQSIVLLIIYRYILSREESKKYVNGKTVVAAYTMAYLSMFVNGNLDFDKIWKQQNLSDGMQSFVGKLCDSIAAKLYSDIKSMNISVLSYCKRRDTYDMICSTDFGLDINDINDDLTRKQW